MKTNGEVDSSQVSGNCRSVGGRDDERNNLVSSYTELACSYIVRRIKKIVEAHDCIWITNHSEAVSL